MLEVVWSLGKEEFEIVGDIEQKIYRTKKQMCLILATL
jgi:hypothetical protein